MIAQVLDYAGPYRNVPPDPLILHRSFHINNFRMYGADMGMVGPCPKASFSDREMLRVDEIETFFLWRSRKRVKGQALFDGFIG